MMLNKPEFARAVPTTLKMPRTEDGRIIIGEDNGDLITLPSFANGNQPFKGMMVFLRDHFDKTTKDSV